MKITGLRGLVVLGMAIFVSPTFSNPTEIQKTFNRLRLQIDRTNARSLLSPPTTGEWEWILQNKSHLDPKLSQEFTSYLEDRILKGSIFDIPVYLQLGGKNPSVLRAFLFSLLERTDRLPSDLRPDHLYFFRYWTGDARVLGDLILQLFSNAEQLGIANLRPFVLPLFWTLKEMSSDFAPANEQNLFQQLVTLPQFKHFYQHLVENFPEEFSSTQNLVDFETQRRLLKILEDFPTIFTHLKPETIEACLADLGKIAGGRSFRKY